MLQGKVILITGGTAGLGRAVVRAFHEAGARVAISYRDEAKLKELLALLREGAQGQLTTVRADVTRWESVQVLVAETLQRLGSIDILVNLAGGFAGGTTVADTPGATWDSMMTLSTSTPFSPASSIPQPTAGICRRPISPAG